METIWKTAGESKMRLLAGKLLCWAGRLESEEMECEAVQCCDGASVKWDGTWLGWVGATRMGSACGGWARPRPGARSGGCRVEMDILHVTHVCWVRGAWVHRWLLFRGAGMERGSLGPGTLIRNGAGSSVHGRSIREWTVKAV